MKCMLVLRLSSMGDVLLTLPVLRGVLDDHPDMQLIFVTRKRFVPYFTNIDRLTVISFDPEGDHKGIGGLFRLYQETRAYSFSCVIDLHGIIRTRILDMLYRVTGKKVYTINKHRRLRKRLLRDRASVERVPHAVDRYRAVFQKAGISGSLSQKVFRKGIHGTLTKRGDEIRYRIGMAPLSKHKTKEWGLANTVAFIQLLSAKDNIEIHLFGGPGDQLILNSLSAANVINHAGLLTPREEVSLIQSMDVFIAMDSANMHLASLAGVPTLSIWGATDPKMGFAALYQPEEYSIHAEQATVNCRPCSVYGEIPCKRMDHPMLCMDKIRPEIVLEAVNKILHQIDCKSQQG